MIEAGALDDPRVDAVAMLHVDPRLPTGTIGITPGPVNASTDELYITVLGTGGHGGYPHKGVDAIPAAAATVMALQNIAARETDPLAPIVISIGTIEGGYRNNVLADKVQLTGTIRTHDPEIRAGVGAARAAHRRRRRRRVQRARRGAASSRAIRRRSTMPRWPKGSPRTSARTRGSRSSSCRRRWAARTSPTSRSASPG